MANRRRVVQEAVDRWKRTWPELAGELRESRLTIGLTQAQVAGALGVSRDRVGRVERQLVETIDVVYLVRTLRRSRTQGVDQVLPGGRSDS
jgi:DNA-binding XRE family transcriptional regulator